MINNRIYKCLNCNRKTSHTQESDLGIYACTECGEFKNSPKLRTILINK